MGRKKKAEEKEMTKELVVVPEKVEEVKEVISKEPEVDKEPEVKVEKKKSPRFVTVSSNIRFTVAVPDDLYNPADKRKFGYQKLQKLIDYVNQKGQVKLEASFPASVLHALKD